MKDNPYLHQEEKIKATDIILVTLVLIIILWFLVTIGTWFIDGGSLLEDLKDQYTHISGMSIF